MTTQPNDESFLELVDLLEDVEDLIAGKQFGPALDLCQKIITDTEQLISEDGPDAGFHLWQVLAEAQNARGVVRDAQGEIQAARAAYQQALHADPGHKDAWRNLRDLEAELREERIKGLRATVVERMEPLHDALESSYDLADSGANEQALQTLDEALDVAKPLFAQLGKHAPRSLHNLMFRLIDERAHSLHKIGRLPDAAEAYRALLQLHPRDREAGRALREIGDEQHQQLFNGYDEDIQQAEQSFQHALDLEEDKRFEEALADCQSVLAVTHPWLERLGDQAPSELQTLVSDAHNLEGMLLDALGREEEAVSALRAALENEPSFRNARLNLKDLLRKMSDARQADGWDRYDETIDEMEQRLLEVRQHVDSAERQEALTAVEELIAQATPIDDALNSDSPADLRTLLAECHHLRGVLLEESGGSREALEAYRAALQINRRMKAARKRMLALEKELGIAHRFRVVSWYYWHYLGSIDQSVLEAHGATAFLPDRAMTRWYFPLAIKGGRVVALSDASEARDILAGDPLVPESLQQIEQEAGPLPRCPHCESWRVGYEAVDLRLAFFTWWLIKIPIMRRTGLYVCRCCGHKWIDLSEGLT